MSQGVELAALLVALSIFAFAAVRKLKGASFRLRETHADDFSPPFFWAQAEPPASERKAAYAESKHVLLKSSRMTAATMLRRSRRFCELMSMRRSLRFFAPTPIPDGVVESCIETACSAPSGAHKQPWRFVIVDSATKRAAIRALVEAEEQMNYEKRMRKSWVDDCLKVVGDLHGKDEAVTKPYLTDAPRLLVAFKEAYGLDAVGKRSENYYVNESCGIAIGILIAALQNVGIATLTSTPMGAESKIRTICGRGANEKVFLLLPLGFPARDATVPYRPPWAMRKPLRETLIVV
jgi:iodotyrosine deiodinase